MLHTKMSRITRTDKTVFAAVDLSLSSLSPEDKLTIDLAAGELASKVKGMGLPTAKEVLYQIGRLLSREETNNSTIRKRRDTYV